MPWQLYHGKIKYQQVQKSRVHGTDGFSYILNIHQIRIKYISLIQKPSTNGGSSNIDTVLAHLFVLVSIRPEFVCEKSLGTATISTTKKSSTLGMIIFYKVNVNISYTVNVAGIFTSLWVKIADPHLLTLAIIYSR